MITNQLALVRRELWEHRSIYVTPAVVALVMILTLLTAFVFASGYQEIVDIGIVGAQNLAGDAERRAALLALLIGNTVPFIFAGAILSDLLQSRFAVCRTQEQEHPFLAFPADY